MAIPKVLIGTPTFDGKNYCLPEFISNVCAFTYPRKRCKFVIFDNSASNENALLIANKFNIQTKYLNLNGYSVFEKLAETHNAIRQYAIDHHFDYLLHLESDVFPPADIIQELIWTKKPIVSATYFIGHGAQRHPIIRPIDHGEILHHRYAMGKTMGNFHHHFTDGKVKPVLTAGIGCILIRRDVLLNFPFRYEQGKDKAPDSFFTNDLYHADVINWVHTGKVCFHWSDSDWGNYSSLLKHNKTI